MLSEPAILIILIIAACIFVLYRSTPHFQTMNITERIIKFLLVLATIFTICITISIVMSVLFESWRFFKQIPLDDFLFGLKWSPQTALRADQGGSSGAFGAVPLFAGTLLITAIAMLVAGPLGLFAAVYISEYGSRRCQYKPGSWARCATSA